MCGKKKNILLVFVTLIFSSCSPAHQIIQTETPRPTITSTLTQEPTATITPTALPEFDICSLENFRDCEITEEELLDGSYFNWLKNVVAPTLAPEFQERYLNGTMQTNVPFVLHAFGEANYISYEPSASFAVENTRPFMRNVTFAWSIAEWIVSGERPDDAPKVGYLVAPVFMYEVTNTETGEGVVHPIVTLLVTREDHARGLVEDYQAVNEPIFYTSENWPSGNVDPVVAESFSKFFDIDERQEAFFRGDYGALSERGLLVISDAPTRTSWYTD